MGLRVDVPIVIDHVEICADAAQIRPSLEQRLALALARGGTVHVDFEAASRGISAKATLALPGGQLETRSFSQTTRGCGSLVRAMGAWVAVRMDEWSEGDAKAEAERRSERERERELAKAATPIASAGRGPLLPRPAPTSTSAIMSSQGPPALDTPFDVDREGRALPEPSGPEISAVSSLWGGIARTTLVGGAVNATFAMNDHFTLRGGLFGYTAAVTDVAAFGHRMDVCRRFPGRYARFHGLALDLCAGGEIGVLERQVFAGFGPSMMIHGDLARGVALDLGGGLGLPFGERVDRKEVSGVVVAYRGDLGISWRLP